MTSSVSALPPLRALSLSVAHTGMIQFASADKEFSKAKSEAEAYAKGAKADALKKIDEIDRKVEEGHSESQGAASQAGSAAND